MNVVMNKPLAPPVETIFDNGVVGAMDATINPNVSEDDTVYQYTIRALITDAISFEESTLQPDREENLKYYHGELPAKEVDDEGSVISSTVVSTDVRDTIMTIIPSLVRIFTSQEHILSCIPNYTGQEEAAKQCTDYLEYIFYEDNPGFMILLDILKDALRTKIGVTKWWTDTDTEVVEQVFNGITTEQLQTLIYENDTVEVVESLPDERDPNLLEQVVLRWVVEKPIIKVESVPLDEFRISRNAKAAKTAPLIGHEWITTISDLIAAGYDEEQLSQFTGATPSYAPDRIFRNSGLSEDNVLSNRDIRYGEYFIRIDKDGDGIDELRKICVVGDSFAILDDYPVQHVNFSVWSPDPEPHTIVGDCPADLVKDIQRIKTNMLRGSLDSLSQSIWPRTVFNETLVNVDDVLNEEIGAAIRTKGNPSETVHSITHQFVGEPVFAMLDKMELLRQARTGINDASRGVDPKALQSTNVQGIDAIVSGSQERIELIARILAQTGLKDTFEGLLREVIASPNAKRTIQLRGEWVDIDPSTYDPGMRLSVNPTLGKGSDTTRMLALQEIKNTQIAIIEKWGIKNPIVTPQNMMHTVEDMAAIANVKNVSRYFTKITPEILKGIMEAPDEPSPEVLLAQAEVEKSRAKVVTEIGKLDFDEYQLEVDDDFRRDELAVNGILKAAQIEMEGAEFGVEAELEEERLIDERNQRDA